MAFALQDVPHLLIFTFHDDKFASAEAGLVRLPQVVEHVHNAGLGEDPAVLLGDEDVRQLADLGDGVVEEGAGGGQAGDVGDQVHLAQVCGDDAQIFFQQAAAGVQGFPALVAPAVHELGKIFHGGGSVGVGEIGGFPVPDEIVLAGFSGADHLQPQKFRPGVEVQKVSGLVTVYQSVDRSILRGDLVEDGAAHAVRLLGDHVDVDALFQSGDGGVGADGGVAGALHHGGDAALHHQLIIADDEDGVCGGLADGFLRGADGDLILRVAHLLQHVHALVGVAGADHPQLHIFHLRDLGQQRISIALGSPDD